MYIEANDDDTHLHFVTKIPKEGIHKNTLDINEFIRMCIWGFPTNAITNRPELQHLLFLPKYNI